MLINIAGGNGPMGSVHKPILEKAGHKVIISGRNSSPDFEEAARISDLTIVTVPIPATEAMIQRVAPHCRAIMDFTGIKTQPIEQMVKYSNPKCEVRGLHPLYGQVSSIEGKTIIDCPTSRPQTKCLEVISAFKNSGAIIKTMIPERHDHLMALTQNARVQLLTAYASLLTDSGVSFQDIYDVSPPPTKIILDLIARQVDSTNQQMYHDMQKFNPHTPGVAEDLKLYLSESDPLTDFSLIRDFFGEKLQSSQDRAKKLMTVK